ncbi:MAG TPA: hypothetical protein VM734_30615 [Kofleriaceae bacterium]|nr:hypothetical protein [Kofleriaceae bacterium]
MSRPIFALAVAAALAAACGDETPALDVRFESAGPHPVGTRWTTQADDGRQRMLTIQVWYPAVAAAAGEAAAGFPVEGLEPEPRRAAYADLLAEADPACPTRTAHAAVGATIEPGGHPLVAFSHCHGCTRWSAMTIAERLASHGFVVVAVDHDGNTLWNRLAGDNLPLDESTLALRVDDLTFAVDQVLAGAPFPELAAAIDGGRRGVFGHSFGAVTAGLYAQRMELGGVFALAAPMENPLLPGVSIASLAEPLGFLVAREDNSVGEIGNILLRNNFAAALGPAWKLEVADAGHWSVSDLVGVVPDLAPGCGAGTRQTDGAAFTYLDAATGRDLAAAHVTAFFAATLLDDPSGRAYLDAGRPTDLVTVERR